MKIYDCFIYFDEDVLLDVRLNILDKFVDKFVIVESIYSHSGKSRKPNFNINTFKKYEKKIEYILLEKDSEEIFQINDNDPKISDKIIINANLREFFQRNAITRGLSEASENDIILISDVDEIPNLEKIDFKKITDNPYMFKQIFCCYKFNLFSNMRWYGTRMIKKKKLLSPQWLRDIKDKNYPKWRIDTFFSKKKYNNIKFIEDGGWHFTCIKKPKDIHKKLLTFAHHQDYEESNINLNQLEEKILQKKVLYDHNKDKENRSKWFAEITLKKINTNLLPDEIVNSKIKYKDWID